MRPTVSGVGVLDKSMAVLGVLELGPASLAELVAAIELPRPTAHRLAVALEAHGLVRRDPDGRFCLGIRLVALGRQAESAFPLAVVAAPALHALRGETGESVQLFVRDGDRRVCVASLESPSELRTIVPVGAVLPLDRGSAGRVLDPGAVAAATKGRRWVETVGEREPGVASVSAPVVDREGRLVAAVSVSGPVERLTRHPGSRYGDIVERTAASISALLP